MIIVAGLNYFVIFVSRGTNTNLFCIAAAFCSYHWFEIVKLFVELENPYFLLVLIPIV